MNQLSTYRIEDNINQCKIQKSDEALLTSLIIHENTITNEEDDIVS